MKSFQLALPIVEGRGAGLGNELLVWGKAFIAAQMLDLRTEHPAWGANTRQYFRDFQTSRYDWVWHRVMRRTLPFYLFNDHTLAKYGGRLQPALQAFAIDNGLPRRGPYVVGLHGMGGGYEQLAPARNFLRTKLLNTQGTLENLFRLDQQIGTDRLRIIFHVRRGDFGNVKPGETYQNKFNVAIPLQWYVRLATNLERLLGDRACFIVVSDAEKQDLAPLLNAVTCHVTGEDDRRDVSDLLTLASADLLVCSISSYSLWGAFLSDRRYCWFAPNLHSHENASSIWGHELSQQLSSSFTSQALHGFDKNRKGRGVAIGWDGNVPDELGAYLRTQAELRLRQSDLVRYGVVAKAD